MIDDFGLRSTRKQKDKLKVPFDKNTFTFEYPATSDPAYANWVWSAMWEGWTGEWRQGGEPCLNNYEWFSIDDWIYRAESSHESLLGKDSAHYVHKTNENWLSEKEEGGMDLV